MDHVIMVLVWYHICDKRVFQGVHAFCGLSILYTYGLHHSWGVLIMTVTSDTSSFWYIRNLMYRAAIHQGFDVSSSRTCSQDCVWYSRRYITGLMYRYIAIHQIWCIVRALDRLPHTPVRTRVSLVRVLRLPQSSWTHVKSFCWSAAPCTRNALSLFWGRPR